MNLVAANQSNIDALIFILIVLTLIGFILYITPRQ